MTQTLNDGVRAYSPSNGYSEHPINRPSLVLAGCGSKYTSGKPTRAVAQPLKRNRLPVSRSPPRSPASRLARRGLASPRQSFWLPQPLLGRSGIRHCPLVANPEAGSPIPFEWWRPTHQSHLSDGADRHRRSARSGRISPPGRQGYGKLDQGYGGGKPTFSGGQPGGFMNRPDRCGHNGRADHLRRKNRQGIAERQPCRWFTGAARRQHAGGTLLERRRRCPPHPPL